MSGLAIALMAAGIFICPATGATTLSYAECRTKVMQIPTYLDGKGRVCGRQCHAAIRRCSDNGGVFN
jgi:hypothetical protein